MDGVIIFADDHVFDNQFEKGLFEELLKEKKHPVIPISNLDQLESLIKSTSSIRALIVDWNFEKDSIALGEPAPQKTYENPYSILNSSQIFSLIYIYSEESGLENTEMGKVLSEKYSTNIKFRVKDGSTEKINSEKDQIINDLIEMSGKSNNIDLAIKWTQAINQSVQSIFYNLNSSDKQWLSDLYKTAESDGVEPSVEVIDLFQHLLAESVIQNKELRDNIKSSISSTDVTAPEQYAKLFRTFLYSQLNPEIDPIMTGDIFKFEEEKICILITPECDISKVSSGYEFLTLKMNDLNKFVFLAQFENSKKELKNVFKSILNRELKQEEREKINNSLKDVGNNILKQIFNQPHPRLYILPFLDVGDGLLRTFGQIDFRDDILFKTKKEVDENKIKRICKLNSPYIQELRQRYLSYKGRVGVPTLPKQLRTWLLES